MSNKTMKEKYVAPKVEVIEVENEGSIMAASAPGFGNGGSMTRSTRTTRVGVRYNTSTFSEVEDLINDILTFEK